jgi:hypothetical protein
MIRASAKFPDHIRAELENRLIMGQDSDVIWRCGGGGKENSCFNVHKFILAINSKVFKVMIKDRKDEHEGNLPNTES